MSKFKVMLKLEGFSLEIEGTREDAPRIAQNIGRQFAGLLEPASRIVEGSENGFDLGRSEVPTREMTAIPVRSRKSRRPSGAPTDGQQPVSWKHDPGKWGNPQLKWSGAQKALWLLYVAGQESQAKDLSSSAVATVFNAMFREAGLIHAKNMPRDLGKLKSQTPPLLGEDTRRTPSVWFLTTEGIKAAEELVREARGIPVPTSN